MFYEEDEINDLLRCSFCKIKFKNTIKNLPCGNAICMDCINELNFNLNADGEFECKVCQEKHRMPKNGFQNNMPLMKLLEKQPKEIYRSEKVDSLKELIKEIANTNKELKSKLNSSTVQVRDYCEDLRYEVHLMTESAIEHLNKINDILIRQIDFYEKDLIKSIEEEKNESFKKQFDESEKLAKKVDEFNDTWSIYLKKLKIDYKDIDKALDKGNFLKEEIQSKIDKQKKALFKNKLLKFEQNKSFFESNDNLGVLTYSSFHKNRVLDDNIFVLNTIYAMPYSDNVALLNQHNLAFGCKDDYSIKILNINDGSVRQTLAGHTLDIDSILTLPNNQLASSSWDTNIKIWNTNTGRLVRTLSGHTDKVYALALLKNGLLASCSQDCTIRIWNYREGRLARTITDYNWIFVLAVLENGDLVSGGADTPIKIWNPNDGSLQKILNGHYNYILSLAVLPNNGLASGSRDATIRIWNTADGLLKHTLIGHTDEVLSICLLPTGNLVSSSKDKTIKIWDKKNNDWHLEKNLTDHTDTVMSLAYLQNGNLISGSYDGTFKIWKLMKD